MAQGPHSVFEENYVLAQALVHTGDIRSPTGREQGSSALANETVVSGSSSLDLSAPTTGHGDFRMTVLPFRSRPLGKVWPFRS
jgi:hypothetical protein